ncbi:TonB-dependent receptor, partial [Tamlana crocina]
RWGDFFSVGASWVISDEIFLQDNEYLTYLKLKGSYGELGNNRGIGYFPYVQAFNTGWNQGTNTGVLLGGVTDPNLTWETSQITNIGLDFAFLNNRIEGSVEWFDKESVDLLYDQPLPMSTGNDAITTNVGSIANQGWEFMIRTRNIVSRDFTWTTMFNFDMVDNEIT